MVPFALLSVHGNPYRVKKGTLTIIWLLGYHVQGPSVKTLVPKPSTHLRGYVSDDLGMVLVG